jgi:thiol-disulfide isomerase/thioredoxin
LFLADANIGRKVYVCINLRNDCQINRGPDHYTEKNPNSKIAFWKLVHLMNWGYEPIFDSIYNSFSDSLKNGYAGKILKTKIFEGKQLSAGKYFPLIPCTDIDKKPFVLDIFKENRYTLVDFWYSGCGPCRAQFDKLKDLYNQFSTKGFEIVAISSDGESSKASWENVIITKKLIWKQYWDMNGIETKKFGINAFLTNYLIDNSGKVIAKNISLEELTQLLNKNLGSITAIEP